MGIVDEDIARVREASDIVAVIGEHVQLKRVGRQWMGLCPFHAEKSGSLSVNQQEGVYYCFGCGAKGDVITFVREIDHVDFAEAVERLAARAGITLRYTQRAEGESRQRRNRLYEAVGRAVDWYHERLLQAPDAGRARGYLRDRGFDGEEVRAYRLGWAPDGWDELARALRLPDDVFQEAGLGFLNRSGRQTDAFRGRLLFPIFDVSDRPVAFGGRILPGGDGPKYKNSAESRIYAKSKTLYGLNWAKAAVVNADEVIVCEGYTDVIGFARAGVPRAVATCGTALTEDHLRVLKGFARRIVLAFDADAAGQHAAERVYEWERALDLELAVADLPAGVDPADLAQRDPARLERAVLDARPFLGFRVARVLDGADLSTPEGRARAADRALEVIREHPNPLVRDQYVMEVASVTRIDADRLRAGAPRARRARGAPSGAARQVARDTAEVEALRLLVARRDEMAPLLDEVLFDDELVLAAYRALRDHSAVRDAAGATDPAAADLLQRVAVTDTDADPADVAALLVQAAAQRALAELEATARLSDDPLAFAEEMAWAKLRMEDLREPATADEAAGDLLGWLQRQRGEGG